jgi:tetratricopeptide (TPR) repeat protein
MNIQSETDGEAALHPRRRTPLRYLFLVCLIAAFPRAALAHDSDGAEADGAVALAEQKASRAFEAYQSKRFSEAVALYIEAYDASPNADILYNVARIYDTKLADRPLAINFYRRYIGDPGAVADRIQLANERLVALREAELAAAQPATTAAAPVARTGAAPVLVPAAPGWSTTELTGVAMAATGVVALGVGAGFGLAAMKSAHTSKDLCNGSVCSEQRGIDANRSARDRALVSTIGFASGGALLALGAAFYFWLGDEPSERPQQASAGNLQLGAQLAQSRGGWSLELAGSW